MNVSLPDQMEARVEAQSEDGRNANASDYVRDLIRRDQERRKAMTALQAAIDEGIRSGPPEPFDLDTFLAEQRAKFGE